MAQAATELLIKTYGDRTYRHATMVRHRGVVIAFAMDEARQIHYAVLDLQRDAESWLDVRGWPQDPRPLPFPAEIEQVGPGPGGPQAMPLVKLGTRLEAAPGDLWADEIDPFLSTTARLSDDAPFQVVSDGVHIHVFRQSIADAHADAVFRLAAGGTAAPGRPDGDYLRTATSAVPAVESTLLCDRYVLSGDELKLKREIRFRRSRDRARPLGAKDTLGPTDMTDVPFHEPTQALGLVGPLTRGRFAALLLPTQVADVQRWQLFVHNAATGRVDLFNFERAEDGRFDPAGARLYTSPDPKYRSSVLERAPGLCPWTGAPLVLVKAGHAGSCLQLDGVDDHATLPAMNPNLAAGITIEAWIHCTEARTNMMVFSLGNAPGSDNISLYRSGSETRWRLTVYNGSSWKPLDTPAGALALGRWQHVAATVDAAGKATIYLDGEPVASATLHAFKSINRTNNFVGRSAWSTASYPPFKGRIDEFRVWKRALTAAEVARGMRARLFGDEADLVHYYRFSEGTGTTVKSEVAGVGNATLASGASWALSDAPFADAESFKIDGLDILGGLGAGLYYQQEGDPGATTKQQARAMLVLGVDRAADAVARTALAVLDFAVSRDGRLSRVPRALPDLPVRADTMPTVHVDGDGLATCGAVLEFASADRSPPSLLDSATGNLHLYFRGQNGQLLGAAWDTRAARARAELSAGSTEVVDFIATRATAELNDITVAISGGSAPDRCKLTATLAGQSASWIDLPREPYALVTAFNADRKGLPLFAATRARGGSLADQSATTAGGRSCRWLDETPGHAREFDGVDDVLTGSAIATRITGDLTLEAWMFPDDLPDRARLIHNVDVSSSYTLGVEAAGGMAALELDGASDHVALPPLSVDLSGGFSLEVWVWFDNVAGASATIVDLGNGAASDNITLSESSLAGGLQLRILRGGSEKTVATPAGVVEANKWIHLAVTVDGDGLATIYRDGAVVATGNCQLPLAVRRADNYLGRSAAGAPYLDGRIAEFRLWDRVRVRNELLADRYRRLLPGAPGLALYYHFEDRLVRDDSGRGHEGVVTAGGLKESGLADATAIELDGTGAHVALPALPFKFDDGLTLEAWVWFDDLAASGSPIVDLEDIALLRLPSSGKLALRHRIDPDAATLATDGDVLGARKWHHVAGTIGPDGVARLYVDGVEKKSGPVPLPGNDGRLHNYVGKSHVPADGLHDGRVDEVRVWGVARTPAALVQDRSRRLGGAEPGLLAYYQFDARSARDLCTRRDARVVGGAAAPSWSDLCALEFDGVDDHLDLGPMTLDTTQGLTVEAWVWFDAFLNWSRIIDFGSGPNSDNIVLCHPGTSRFLRLVVFLGGAEYAMQTDTEVLTASTWMHLAFTIDAQGNATIYKDGAAVKNGSLKRPNGILRSKNYVGRSNWGSDGHHDGRLDELRIWTYVRTAEEILANKDRRLHGRERGLFRYYHFEGLRRFFMSDDGPIGSFVPDFSANDSLAAPFGCVAASSRIDARPALRLSGAGECVVVPALHADFSAGMTLEAWVLFDELAGNTAIFGLSTDPHRLVMTHRANGSLAVSLHDGETLVTEVVTRSDILEAGRWTHVAVTMTAQAQNNIKLWVGGAVIKTGTGKLPPALAWTYNTLGFATGGHGFLKGRLDEVRGWSRALDDEDMRALWHRRVPAGDPGLLFCYRFGAATARDLGPAAAHGTVEGTAAAPDAPVSPARSFDGVDDHVVLPAIDADLSQGFTLEAWVRFDGTQKWARIIDIGRGQALDNIFFSRHGTTAQLAVRIYNGANYTKTFLTGDVIVLGKWMHVAVTLDAGKNVKIYVDGDVACSDVTTLMPAQLARPLCYLGKSNWSWDEMFRGALAEVRVWSAARSQADIQATMTAPPPANSPGLVRAYRLAPPPAVDHSGRGHDGAVVGGVATLSPLKSQAALAFNGTSTAVELPAMALELADGFTLEAWVYYDATATDQRILDFGTGGVADAVFLARSGATNKLTLSVARDAATAVTTATDVLSLGAWIHVAATVDATGTATLYVDGVVKQTGPCQLPRAVSRAKNFLGRRHTSASGYHKGRMDEVRVWNHARTADQIAQLRDRRVQGDEDGLLLCYRFDGGRARNVCARVGWPDGGATGTAALSPVKSHYRAFAGAQGKVVRTDESFPQRQWEHLAFAFRQAHALKFSAGTFVDCGDNDVLNIPGDLTLEVTLKVANFVVRRGVLSKGGLRDGTGQSVPYQLCVETDGKLSLSFEGKDGQKTTIVSAGVALAPGRWHRIAVTRRHSSEVLQIKGSKQITVNGQPTSVETITEVKGAEWDEIVFYVDRVASQVTRFEGVPPSGHRGDLEIGRCLDGAQVAQFLGEIGEVRLWAGARDRNQLGLPIDLGRERPAAWWRLDEGRGTLAGDAAGESHGRIRGAQWVADSDPRSGDLAIFRNGLPVQSTRLAADDPLVTDRGDFQLTLGARKKELVYREFFRGTLEEVRLWKLVRTPEQVMDSMFTRHRGDLRDLIAYYTFEEDEGGTRLLDGGLREVHLALPNDHTRPARVLSTVPISDDGAIVRAARSAIGSAFHETIGGRAAAVEYGELQRDARGENVGVMKRCYAYTQGGQWRLMTGYRVGDLTSEWVGQAQWRPQIIGYIEGAPPIPGENMHTAARVSASVELVEADSVNYTYTASREHGFASTFELAASAGFEFGYTTGIVVAPLGFGTTISPKVKLEIATRTRVEAAGAWTAEQSVGTGRTRTRSFSVALTGTPESDAAPANAVVGPRLIPNNLGFALVQSETADIYALRLAHSGALVALRFEPNPDIPPDWNLIPFKINPLYTKQGTLDGRIGFTAGGAVLTDQDYVGATEQGEFSYYKPREAYALKRRIEREEQALHNFYAAYDASTVDDPFGGALKSTDGFAAALAGLDPTGTAGAVASFASLQDALKHKDDDLPARIAARNVVNTYVWTAAGGFFAETTRTTDVQSESASGHYSFTTTGSGNTSLQVAYTAALGLELSGSLSGRMNLVRSKRSDATRSFGLSLSVQPSADLRTRWDAVNKKWATADSDVAGKVDAYRFMTFYLEPDERNFEDLFSKVVDPTWLSDQQDLNARALRQAQQSDKKPPCWRVLHRVTFVSRVLPPDTASLFLAAVKAAGFASTMELVQYFEPFVTDKTSDPEQFQTEILRVLAANLPALSVFKTDVVKLLAGYHGVEL